MVVTCPECGTRFAVDESLIRGESAKGRCSRCGHIFVLRRPAAEPREEPVPGPEPGGPSPEPDIPEKPPAAAVLPAEPAEAAEATAPAVQAEPVVPSSLSPPATAASRRWWLLAVILVVLGGAGVAAWHLLPFLTQAREGRPTAPAPAAPPAAPLLPPPSPAELRDIRIDLGEATFGRLVHPQAGRLLVLTGEVVNQGGQTRGPVKLRAALVDAQHREVARRQAYAGITLSDKELVTLAPAEIERRLETPRGREATLAPQERRPFTVVFFDVPADLAEAGYGFTLEVVEAPPAARP